MHSVNCTNFPTLMQDILRLPQVIRLNLTFSSPFHGIYSQFICVRVSKSLGVIRKTLFHPELPCRPLTHYFNFPKKKHICLNLNKGFFTKEKFFKLFITRSVQHSGCPRIFSFQS